MQRTTPIGAAFRAYTSGGARAMIDTINDATHMQESTNSQGMRGESWPTMESPQNYGFTSVVADATKGAGGMIQDCAEGFVSFMGGSRSFPVMGIMDDRRHRLINLAKDAAKGAVAMFGLKEWGQQLLNNVDGMYMTGNIQNKIRIALVKNSNQQQQSSQSGSGVGAQQLDASGASGSSPGQSGGQQKGQKTLHKQDSTVWIEQNQTSTTCAHGDAQSSQKTGSDSSVYYKDRTTSSCQSTTDHAHIRTGNNRVFVDASGCWTTTPIQIKLDSYCKT
jgi:phage gp45-like